MKYKSLYSFLLISIFSSSLFAEIIDISQKEHIPTRLKETNKNELNKTIQFYKQVQEMQEKENNSALNGAKSLERARSIM